MTLKFKAFVCIMTAGIFMPAAVVYGQPQLSQNMDGFNASDRLSANIDSRPVKDSTVVERDVPKDYTQWRFDQATGTQIFLEPDTLMDMFFNKHLTQGLYGTYSNLGNMGSPRLSRIYTERMPTSAMDFVFDDPYDFFVKSPWDFRFTDTKTPHLNLTYFKGGNKYTGEEHIKGYFAANFGKKTGFGIDIEYLLGRGRYDAQATSMFDARLYAYHRRDKYSIYATVNSDDIKVAENGGVTNDRYITNPEAMAQGKKKYKPEDIPVMLSSNWNNLKRKQLGVVQHYDIYKITQWTDSIADTIITRSRYDKAGTITHSLQAGSLTRRLISYSLPQNYYQYQYLRADSIDKQSAVYLDNILSMSMHEGFSKWALASLTAYARYELRGFTQPDTIAGRPGSEYAHKVVESNMVLGGILERATGKNLNLRIAGETIVLGTDFADINVTGDVSLNFNLFNQESSLTGRGTFSAVGPTYFWGSYHGENVWWDKELSKEIITGIGGTLNIPATRTHIQVDVRNINNYAYLADIGTMDSDGIMHNVSIKQNDGALQVFSASLNQNFKLGPLHWDNKVSYQKTSNSEILPLPDLNVYSNLYLKFVYAKRLRMELGADVTYFTKYYAPDYSVAVGQYVLQNEFDRVQVGNYPLISAYANCTLRGVRFYVMMYHLNNQMLKLNNAFWAPHYPMAPEFFKMGLSWTFYD